MLATVCDIRMTRAWIRRLQGKARPDDASYGPDSTLEQIQHIRRDEMSANYVEDPLWRVLRRCLGPRRANAALRIGLSPPMPGLCQGQSAPICQTGATLDRPSHPRTKQSFRLGWAESDRRAGS